MDAWKKGLRRALGETIGPAEFGFADAMAATRRITKFNRLSQHLKGLDAMAAARKGIGPAEFTAIMDLRMSEIPAHRVDDLYDLLIEGRCKI